MTQSVIAWYVSTLLILGLFLSSTSLSLAQEKKTLRIVFVSLSWNNQLPFRVAITKGFFKDQGLTVEPIFVRGGPTALAALISGCRLRQRRRRPSAHS
ncbi:MAG TPA: hypothetical protein VLJ79_21770 [Candidatus Binatia bacterium]|nr:hypothetical protein [Candidatus Binatia bacterium]